MPLSETEQAYALQCINYAKAVVPEENCRLVSAAFILVNRLADSRIQPNVEHLLWMYCRKHGLSQMCNQLAFFVDADLEERLVLLSIAKASEIYIYHRKNSFNNAHLLKFQALITVLSL